MSNVSNLLNLATLANSLQGLKGQASGTAFYTDFAKGLDQLHQVRLYQRVLRL